MAIEEIHCTDWEHFQKLVRGLAGFEDDFVFRGQSDANWRLTSMWERVEGERLIQIEPLLDFNRDIYLQKFQRFATKIPGFQAPAMDDKRKWLMLGRHYGLVTPLLDWTSSPYIAAFFAYAPLRESGFKDLENRSVAVWVMHTSVMAIESEEFWCSWESDSCLHRQNAQCGAFTYLFDRKYRSLDEYFEVHHKPMPLKKLILPGAEVLKVLHDLFLMDIHFASIYPDLEGAAKQANLFSFFMENPTTAIR